MTNTETRKVSEIVWREDLYPRFEPNPAVIQRYAEDVEQYPSVEINQHDELIDGYHRWTAHKKAEAETIKVTVTETDSDRHFARLAMRRNAQHGLHISNAEKKDWLLGWYTGAGEVEKQELAIDMGVSLRTVKRWTARKDKDLKAKRKRKAFDLWLACETLEGIAEQMPINDDTVSDYVKEYRKKDNWQKSGIFPDYSLDPAWVPPIYNVWKKQIKSMELNHSGNSEATFLDYLLYLYTDPFSIVVDPFAGSGSTVEICKRRLRRYWVSDRLPIIERRDIRTWDILDGTPPLHKRWGDVELLYLDPPYWKQAENEYSNDVRDLANMELSIFHNSLIKFIAACAAKMRVGYIAMLMQPTQWRSPRRQVIDHAFAIRQAIDLPLEITIQCPYESQQANAQQVIWAKENKRLLEIGRTITVWRVGE